MARTPRPFEEDDEQQLRDLHGQGFGRDQIARLLDRSSYTITVHAEKLGLAVLITSVVDTGLFLIMAKTSGVVGAV
ncbi:hypothetical protein ACFFSH_38690 [Streptomyces filamentosus]|nr:hypothetical protein [Streptomyces filamentosus]